MGEKGERREGGDGGDARDRAGDAAPNTTGIHVPVGDVEAVLLIGDVIDVAAETTRLRGKLESVAKDLAGLNGRLSNTGFVDNAPEEVVAKVRNRAVELASEAERLRQHLAALEA